MFSVYRSDLGSGAATPFNPNLKVINVDDVITCPEPSSSDDVEILQDVVLKPGAEVHNLYVTADSIVLNQNTVGEIDQEGFETTLEGNIPGNNVVSKKLQKQVLKGNYMVFLQLCKGGAWEMMGSCCNPIRISFSVEQDKDKTITKVMMKRPYNTDEPNYVYLGNLPTLEPTELIGAGLDITIAGGKQYTIADTVNGVLTINTMEFEHGAIITLIGQGGDTPATLDTIANSVLLKDGLTWTTLKDSTISFQVFDDGTNKILVETGRA